MRRLICFLLGHDFGPWRPAEFTKSVKGEVKIEDEKAMGLLFTALVNDGSGWRRVSSSLDLEDVKSEQRECRRCGKREHSPVFTDEEK